MNTFVKNRLTGILIVMLVIANIITIASFWMKKEEKQHSVVAKIPPKGPAFEFIIHELKMDSVQQINYEQLRLTHRRVNDSIRKLINEERDQLFGMLKQENPADSAVQNTLNRIASQERSILLNTFTHFAEVKAICNKEQQVKFTEIIQEAIRMMGMQRPQGRGPHPPPPHKDQRGIMHPHEIDGEHPPHR